MSLMIAEAPLVYLPDFDEADASARRFRLTREDCETFERIGRLPERYELIDGVILDKMGQNRLHAVIIVLLMKGLNSVFGDLHVQIQLPIEVALEDKPTNQPIPDASVLVRPVTEFLHRTPDGADLRLIVEVADSSIRFDTGVKAALYARAGVPEYWVLDATRRKLIVHRDPNPATGVYAAVRTCSDQESMAPLSAPNFTVTAAALIPDGGSVPPDGVL